MKVTHVEVGVGVTKNVGNYESIRVDERCRVELGPGESAEAVREKTLDWLTTRVDEDATMIANDYIASRGR